MQNEIISILIKHAKKYPQLTPCDVVKLLYQNEFGGGHLIRDARECLMRIKEELATIPLSCADVTPEDIGNNLVRFPLSALHKNILSPEKLNQIFILSSAVHKGNMPDFIQKIKLLRDTFSEIPFSFSKEEMDLYLSQYAEAGYPMVSHSEQYRRAYKPTYRIIRKSFLHSF